MRDSYPGTRRAPTVPVVGRLSGPLRRPGYLIPATTEPGWHRVEPLVFDAMPALVAREAARRAAIVVSREFLRRYMRALRERERRQAERERRLREIRTAPVPDEVPLPEPLIIQSPGYAMAIPGDWEVLCFDGGVRGTPQEAGGFEGPWRWEDGSTPTKPSAICGILEAILGYDQPFPATLPVTARRFIAGVHVFDPVHGHQHTHQMAVLWRAQDGLAPQEIPTPRRGNVILPRDEPFAAPAQRPRPSPRLRPLPRPDEAIEVGPDGRIRRGPAHRFRRPERRVRERKVRINVPFIGLVTEGLDLIDAVYKGIGWRNRRFRGRDGRWRDKHHGPVEKLEAIWEHWNDLETIQGGDGFDFQRALDEFTWNIFEDAAIGFLAKGQRQVTSQDRRDEAYNEKRAKERAEARRKWREEHGTFPFPG